MWHSEHKMLLLTTIKLMKMVKLLYEKYLTCPNFIPVKGYSYFPDDGIAGNFGTEWINQNPEVWSNAKTPLVCPNCNGQKTMMTLQFGQKW